MKFRSISDVDSSSSQSRSQSHGNPTERASILGGPLGRVAMALGTTWDCPRAILGGPLGRVAKALGTRLSSSRLLARKRRRKLERVRKTAGITKFKMANKMLLPFICLQLVSLVSMLVQLYGLILLAKVHEKRLYDALYQTNLRKRSYFLGKLKS